MMSEKRFTIDENGNITDTIENRVLYVENKYTECNYFVDLLDFFLLSELGYSSEMWTSKSSSLSRLRKPVSFPQSRKYQRVRSLQLLKNVSYILNSLRNV